MLHIIWYIVTGFLVGLLARAILPGADHLGFIGTTAVGIVGSIVGGRIGHLMHRPAPGAKAHPTGLLMSVVGAIVLLLIVRLLR